MNREIKFRGKDDKGRWWFGDLRHTMMETGKPHCRIVDVDEDQDGRLQEIWSDPIKEETIGQYIGIDDNEGRHIYEGDILDTPIFRGMNVVFGMGSFCMNTLYGATHYFDAWADKLGEFKVMANIHDNPELLKGGEK